MAVVMPGLGRPLADRTSGDPPQVPEEATFPRIAIIESDGETPAIAAAKMPPTDGRPRRRHRQLRPRRRRHQRPPAPRFGFDSDWIVKRTGILERRHALPHQATSDLCHEAARPLHRPAPASAARHRPARPGHVHAGHVVSVDGLPGAGPAQAELRRHRGRGGLRGFMYALITGAAYVVSGRQRPGPDHRRRLQLAHPQPERHQDLSALRRRRRRRAADRAAGRTRASSATAWAPTAAAATC